MSNTTAAPPRPRYAPPRSTSSRSGPAIDPFRVLRRHALILIASAMLGVMVGGAGFVVLNRYLPRYSSQVLFELQPQLREANAIVGSELSQEDLVVRMARTETVLITTTEVLQKAVTGIDLKQTAWAQQYKDPNGSFDTAQMVEDLQEDLGASYMRNTNLFSLSWEAERPADVPIVLNQIAQTYMDTRRRIDKSDFEDNERLFTDLLTRTENEIRDMSTQIETFIKEKGIVTLDDTRHSQTMLSINDIVARINAADQQLAAARTSLILTEGKIRGTLLPTEEDRFAAEQSPLIQALNQTITSLEIDYRVSLENFNAEHREVVAIDQRLRAARDAKEDELETIMTQGLSSQYKLLENEIAQVTEMLDQLQSEYEKKDLRLRDMSSDMSQYKTLEGRRERLQELRDSREGMLDELLLLEARSDNDRVAILEGAQLPREKSFPKLTVVVPLSMLACVGLTLGLIFLRELTDRRIKSAADLQIIPGASVLGVVPDLSDDPTRCKRAELVVRDHPQSVLAESYRQTGASIWKTMDRAQHQSLLLLGGLPGAGTTTLVANLAASVSATGRSVITIDANYRRPRLGTLMGGTDDGPGLGDLLAGDATLDDVITSGEDVDVIGAGTPALRLYERFSNAAFDSMLAELRDRYDLVLIDTAPAVVAGDAMMIANKVDAAVLVLRAYQEHRGLAGRLINQLSDMSSQFVGIVLNRPRGTAGGYFKKNFETMAAYGRKSA